MPQPPPPGETPESLINPVESLNRVFTPSFSERLELFGLHTRLLMSAAKEEVKRLFLRVNNQEGEIPLGVAKPDGITALKLVKPESRFNQNSEEGNQTQPERLNILLQRQPVIKHYLNIIGEFRNCKITKISQQGSLPFIIKNEDEIKAHKELITDKKKKHQRNHPEYKPKCKVNNIQKVCGQGLTGFAQVDKCINLIIDGHESTATTVACVLAMSNTGIFQGITDPGGYYPRTVSEEGKDLKILTLDDIEPDKTKTYMSSFLRAFALRQARQLFEGFINVDIENPELQDELTKKGLGILCDPEVRTVVIAGKEGQGKSTLVEKLSNRLPKSIGLQMNSPQKIIYCLRQLGEGKKSQIVIAEQAAHLSVPKSLQSFSKIERITSALLGKEKNLSQDDKKSITARFFETFSGLTSIQLFLLSLPSVKGVAIPFREEHLTQLFQRIADIDLKGLDTVNMLKSLFECFPKEILNIFLTAVELSTPEILLMATTPPENASEDSKSKHTKLFESQAGFIEGRNQRFELEDKPREGIYFELIKAIENEFPAETLTKQTLINLLRQLALLYEIYGKGKETDPLP